MTACNVVRFKVKPGMDQKFLDAHAPGKTSWPGFIKAQIIKTGEGAYCLIGEWSDAAALAAARPGMIATLDTFRDTLEPGATGVTDAVSGPVVLTLT
jgi:quinol monooxygenase YgiN